MIWADSQNFFDYRNLFIKCTPPPPPLRMHIIDKNYMGGPIWNRMTESKLHSSSRQMCFIPFREKYQLECVFVYNFVSPYVILLFLYEHVCVFVLNSV